MSQSNNNNKTGNQPKQGKGSQKQNNQPQGQGGLSKSARKRANKAKNAVNTVIKTDLVTAAYLADDLVQSVVDGAQTLFNPRAGLHRPYGTSMDESALVNWESKFQLTYPTSSANNVWNVVFCPSMPKAAAQSSISYASSIINPYLATGTTNIPGAFNTTNPATTYRCISYEVELIPIGQVTSYSGELTAAYISNDIQSAAAVTNIMQKKYSIVKNASEHIILHWFPNPVEVGFSTSDVAATNASGLVLQYSLPSSTSQATMIDVIIRAGYEYVPNNSYYPYVNVSSNNALPLTNHYLSKKYLSKDNYEPYVMGTYDDWKSKMVRGRAGHTHGGSTSAMRGVFNPPTLAHADRGNQNLKEDLDEEREDEEEEFKSLGEAHEIQDDEVARYDGRHEQYLRKAIESPLADLMAGTIQASTGIPASTLLQVGRVVSGSGDRRNSPTKQK